MFEFVLGLGVAVLCAVLYYKYFMRKYEVSHKVLTLLQESADFNTLINKLFVINIDYKTRKVAITPRVGADLYFYFNSSAVEKYTTEAVQKYVDDTYLLLKNRYEELKSNPELLDKLAAKLKVDEEVINRRRLERILNSNKNPKEMDTKELRALTDSFDK